jgi:hypothetical protein
MRLRGALEWGVARAAYPGKVASSMRMQDVLGERAVPTETP